MPSRFEYIQTNLKTGSQQKTQAGLCKQPELTLPLQNNWTAFLAGTAKPFRVWKDASGSVQMNGVVVAPASLPVLAGGYYQVTTIPPGYRPSLDVVTTGVVYDASAVAQFPCFVVIEAATGIVKASTAVVIANGDFVIINGAWVGA